MFQFINNHLKNKDKLGKDNEWFEKLGYEMGIGLVFTFVGNKIMTKNEFLDD